jgi:arylsulfatase A-like enzyme
MKSLPGLGAARALASFLVVGLILSTGGRFTPLTAQVATPPNVLIFVTDDQREGFEVMPNTRRWLRDAGTRYLNATATTPLCCPSRASIFTGRYAHNHGVIQNDMPEALDQKTTMQFHLDQAGYRSGIFGKYLNFWRLADDPPHFDRWAIFRRNDAYINADWNVQGTVRAVSEYATNFIGNQVQSFFSQQGDSPWLLYLAPPNPHGPYTAEPKYQNAPIPPWDCNPAVHEADRSDKPPYVRTFDHTCSQGKATRTKQLRTLRSVDDLVGRVMSMLQLRQELDETLVFFISDNGRQWSEHGLDGKRHAYLQSIRVPMLARWPGHIPAGDVDRNLVANIDIAPTVLDAAGISPAIPMDGSSLRSGDTRTRILTEHWSGGPAPWSAVPDWASMLTRSGHYIEFYDAAGQVTFREFYDLRTDPWELSNQVTPPQGWAAQLAEDRDCAGTACP